MVEIVQDRSGKLIGAVESHNFRALPIGDHLSIARVSDRLILIILEANVTEMVVENIFNINPAASQTKEGREG